MFPSHSARKPQRMPITIVAMSSESIHLFRSSRNRNRLCCQIRGDRNNLNDRTFGEGTNEARYSNVPNISSTCHRRVVRNGLFADEISLYCSLPVQQYRNVSVEIRVGHANDRLSELKGRRDRFKVLRCRYYFTASSTFLKQFRSICSLVLYI
ncbi:hypothetical protein CDAR_190301 [Caerostris darwini]|uniref:Uncharacterized protein n=1 Tax=Caerostris darwini TaxID=1538125 RepID=A0AAV4MLY5_9ARAC|nr:hypothetical protein CDAR_190301 [Caerostris darwini]